MTAMVLLNMGKLSRNKGARWERRVANLLTDALGEDCRRSGNQSREGSDAPDVVAPVFWPECKVGKSFSIKGAMAQATRDMEKSHLDKRWAVAITKVDNERPLATMYLDDFLDLIREWRTRSEP